MTELTNAGVEQKMLMVDYTVPATGGAALDRSRDLGPCERGDSATTTAVELDKTQLPFGNQRSGVSSAVQTVKVTNYTSTPLRIDSVTLGGAVPAAYSVDANATTCPINTTTKLETFTSCTIGVRFKPTANTAQNATLVIATDSPGYRMLTVALTGAGISPAVSLSATTLAFGQQQINTTSPAQQITVRNTGNAPLTFTSIKVTAPFMHTRTCPNSTGSLAPGATCTISVAFRPTSKGAINGSLTITDDAGGSPRTIALRGVGASVALSTSGFNFGTQVVNTSSAARSFTITNNGTLSLPIASIGISGAQAASFGRTHTCPTSLAVGASCTVSVMFKPTISGTNNATLNVVYNAKTTPRTVTLTGVGTALDVSPTTLNFGDQKLGTTSAARIITLANRGTTAITLGAQTMGGAYPANFTRTTTCGSTLAPNATCTISIAFAPRTTGIKTASVSIASNAAGGSRMVVFSGNGTP